MKTSISAVLMIPTISWAQIVFSCLAYIDYTPNYYVYVTDQYGSYMKQVKSGKSPSAYPAEPDLSPCGVNMTYLSTWREMGYWNTVLFVDLDYLAPYDGLGVYDSFSSRVLSSPSWSPENDGRIAVVHDSREIIIVTFTSLAYDDFSGIHIPSKVLGNMDVEDVDWAPGERFVYSTREGEIWITDGNSSHFLSEGWTPKVSPDGSKVAFVSPDRTENELWTMNLNGSNKEIVHTWKQRGKGEHSVAWLPGSHEILFVENKINEESDYLGLINAVKLDGSTRTILDTGKEILSIDTTSPWETDQTVVRSTSWGALKKGFADE